MEWAATPPTTTAHARQTSAHRSSALRSSSSLVTPGVSRHRGSSASGALGSAAAGGTIGAAARTPSRSTEDALLRQIDQLYEQNRLLEQELLQTQQSHQLAREALQAVERDNRQFGRKLLEKNEQIALLRAEIERLKATTQNHSSAVEEEIVRLRVENAQLREMGGLPSRSISVRPPGLSAAEPSMVVSPLSAHSGSLLQGAGVAPVMTSTPYMGSSSSAVVSQGGGSSAGAAQASGGGAGAGAVAKSASRQSSDASLRITIDQTEHALGAMPHPHVPSASAGARAGGPAQAAAFSSPSAALAQQAARAAREAGVAEPDMDIDRVADMLAGAASAAQTPVSCPELHARVDSERPIKRHMNVLMRALVESVHEGGPAAESGLGTTLDNFFMIYRGKIAAITSDTAFEDVELTHMLMYKLQVESDMAITLALLRVLWLLTANALNARLVAERGWLRGIMVRMRDMADDNEAQAYAAGVLLRVGLGDASTRLLSMDVEVPIVLAVIRAIDGGGPAGGAARAAPIRALVSEVVQRL